MDVARVVEVYAPATDGAGWEIGSGYRISDELVLTAAHVVAGLPLHPPESSVSDDPNVAGGKARPLGRQETTSAVVVWRDQDADVAVLRLAADAPTLPAGSPTPRWGRKHGTEPIAVDAVGFPWAQERPDEVRDTEHLHGFLASGTQLKAGLLAITALTSPPADRGGGSPWAGMSGAAVFAGPFLIGVVIVDPGRFGPARVLAAPIAPLLTHTGLGGLVGALNPVITPVEPRMRLAVTADTSVAIAPPYRAPTDRLGREPSRLLLPEYGIVPFLGREAELEELEEWCLTGGGAALRLLLGAGGAGKTRLAAEACLRMTGRGWQAGLADPSIPGGEPVLNFDRPTLVVVDDADLNVPLLEALVRALGYWPTDAPPVRLLLLARHTTGWWNTLNRRSNQLAAELTDRMLSLREGELPRTHRAAHHAEAVASFTRHLMTRSQDLPPEAEPPASDLGDAAFANPLLVHMHALLVATGAHVSTTDEEVRERVLDAVLDRERNRWAQTFPSDVPTRGDLTRQQAVTVTTLFAPPTEHATTELLSLISDFIDAPAGIRGAVATWLHGIYPGTTPVWVVPLRPDLLTEQLLATCAELTDLVLTGYGRITDEGNASGAQAEQVLAELTRAAGRNPVSAALDRLLSDRLPDLLDAALINPAGRLPDLLDRALTKCPQPQTAAALIERLPEYSTGLATLAVTVTAQAVDHHRHLAANDPEAFNPDLAGSLNDLSGRLAALGRLEEALAAIEEAVTLRRALAAAYPDAFISDLAGSLHNLSVMLAYLGRREEALTAIEEATGVYQQLATTYPGAFTPHLAGSLNTLSNRLGALGRREEALAAIEESTSVYRQLANTDPAASISDLAGSLHNLSGRLAELGRREEALTTIQESTSVYRQLATTDPDAFTPDLARSLHNLSSLLGDLRRREEALAAIEEATAVDRALCAARPAAFAPNLATSLHNLSGGLADLGRLEEALAAIEEAATLRRALAAAYPDAFISDLAGSLHNLSVILARLGRREEALTAIEEATGVYQQLATTYPGAFTPHLARSLDNLSGRLGALGRREEALAAIEEAVALRRALAAAHPDAHTPDLAASVNNLAIRLAALGRHGEALTAIEEALAAYRPLAIAHPAVYAPDLATTLSNLAGRLAALGRREEALSAIKEATSTYRQLATTYPAAFTPAVADSLRLYGSLLTELRRHEDALAADREVVAIYRGLHARHSDSYKDALTTALAKLALDLRALDLNAEAEQVEREAARLAE
ncbi:Tetratricopeptide repeat-containing protein [Geodermatophilus saharensis]|uniref:Tetratricopeptide repeat-containing protein n=1 Tax=Geodermatophilus saharensis TaxID=1137994 RepID=A0A238ZIG7_9ACTN|nr:tetratricopeptide repeat protein [Geodermatophilus saharensis]SNR82493.1 Tetratricopeptide repeat-containing protein [Geodermatophilus saharensis]